VRIQVSCCLSRAIAHMFSTRHWLVWTLLPLVDWNKAAPFVQERGLAGRYSTQTPELRLETEGYKTEGVCKEIEAFARMQWPDATDVLWLVNPVKLQSVPALVSLPTPPIRS
jgi:hypothetical protein